MKIRNKISSKVDAQKFATAVAAAKKAGDLSGKALAIASDVAAISRDLDKHHGRAQKARDLAKTMDIKRGQLALAITPTNKQAPKKAANSKPATKKSGTGKKKFSSSLIKEYAKDPGTGTDDAGNPLCLCGCGNEVAKNRNFLQGHDMRLIGKVRAVLAGKLPRSAIPRRARPYLSSNPKLSHDDKKELGLVG